MPELPPEPKPQEFSVPVVIEHDVRCQGCGYNLRGLRSDGRCPECGAAVVLSFLDNVLQFANPDWLRKVTRGAWVTTFAFGGGFLVTAVAFIAALVGRFVGLALPLVLLGCMCATVLMLMTGAWITAAPHPSDSQRESWSAPRRLIRYGVAAIPCTAVAAATAYFVSGSQALAAVLALGSPLGALGLLGAIGTSRYYAALARRAGDRPNAQRARQYMGIFGAGWMCLTSAILTLPSNTEAGSVLLLPAVFLAGGGGVLLLTLPANMVKHLADCRQLADARWQMEIGRATPAPAPGEPDLTHPARTTPSG